ncbi:MAG TPA: DUF302 domain-containing protein [Acidimicrobiales bacterium]|nr:DUF302 domain-containing protein [Acidimicrobiales bacterium]
MSVPEPHIPQGSHPLLTLMKALERDIDQPLEDVEASLRSALSEQGFGVLTEIDVAATFAAKLGVHRPPMKILGACNPSLAHRALGIDASVALLLPCNVVLTELAAGGTHVAVADPRTVLRTGTGSDDRLAELGEEASAGLERALDRLGR